MLSLIITYEPFVLLVILGIPIAFLWFLPSARRNWRSYSRVKRGVIVGYGLAAALCIIAVFVVALILIQVGKSSSQEHSNRIMRTQISIIDGYLFRYRIEYDEEYSKGDVVDVWQAVLEANEGKIAHHDDRLRLRTNEEGALIDLWDNPVRFRLNDLGFLRAYSAGRDGVFSTVDDLPDKM